MSTQAETLDNEPDDVVTSPPTNTMATPIMLSANAHPSRNPIAFGRPPLAVSNNTPPRIGMGSSAMTRGINDTFGFMPRSGAPWRGGAERLAAQCSAEPRLTPLLTHRERGPSRFREHP